MQPFLRLLACALMALAVTWSTASQAERRVALVIGNGGYKNVPGLPNPPKDAVAMAALLRNLGFDVVTGSDLNRDGMSDRLRTFADKADGADVALFFYAGHGISLEGKNYLLPVDANLKNEFDVKMGGPIDVEVMLQQTMSSAKVKLVFLDACRDNPFVEQISRSVKTRSLTVSSGLSEMKSGEGTLLAFATGPGQVALDGRDGHSPFTTALLHNLSEPGMEIRLALTKVRAEVTEITQKKQLPWENTNLTGFFFMNPTATGNAATVGNPDGKVASLQPAAPAQAQPAGSNVEVEFWRSVKDSKHPEELNAYLTRYPSGEFSSIARARLAELNDPKNPISRSTSSDAVDVDPATKTADANIKTEQDVALDQNSRRDVQRRLKLLGFATPVSGKFSDETRRAITNWQAARGYPVSGFLNKLQYTALKAEPLPKVVDSEDEEQPRKRARAANSGAAAPSGGAAVNNNNNGGPPAAAVGAFFGGALGGMMRHR